MRKIKFTKRKGISLAIMAPVLFLLSGLFLANTVFYPAESFPYQVGRLLCFVVTPVLLISGIFMYAVARRAEKKAKPIAETQVPMPSREEISTPKIEVTLAKAVEPSPRIKKIRKYAKITAIAGAGISAASLIINLGPIFLIGIAMAVASTIPLVRTKPKGQKVTEMEAKIPPRMRKMRRIMKITALSGVLISIVSFILLLFSTSRYAPYTPDAPPQYPVLYENQPVTWNGVFIGGLIAVASSIARSLMEPAPAELHVRKILGALLILLGVDLLVLTCALFGTLVPPIMLFLPIVLSIGIYLFQSKRCHLFVDIFLVFPGWWLYTLNDPNFLGPPTSSQLKEFLFAFDWSWMFPQISLVFGLIKILILASAIFSVAGGILSHSKTFVKSTKRGLIIVVISSVIVGILFGMPLLQSVEVRQRGHAISVSINYGSSIALRIGSHPWAFNIGFRDVSVTFDSENNLWIYQIAARNWPPQEEGEIIGIVAQKQPHGRFSIIPEKWQLAPPFGEGIEVVGGEKTSEKIVVKPGYTARLRISSKDPLLSIVLIGKRCSHDISFWSLEPQGEDEYTGALDPNVNLILTNASSAAPQFRKTSFASGEPVYPWEQGLKNGTRFGFRVVDSKGAVVVPLDINGWLAEARGSTLGGTVWEGYGRFNLKEEPLFPGSYRMELIKVESGKGFIVAYVNFSIT